MKDLVDLALLIGSGQLVPHRVVEALHVTFERRKTHALPAELPPPPADWHGPFRTLAAECAMPADMDSVFTEVRAFFTRVLAAGTKL